MKTNNGFDVLTIQHHRCPFSRLRSRKFASADVFPVLSLCLHKYNFVTKLCSMHLYQFHVHIPNHESFMHHYTDNPQKKKETKKNSLSHLQLVLHPLFTIQFILTRSSLSISLTWMKKNETKKLHSTQSTRNKVKQNEKTIAIGFIDMDKVGGCFLRHNHSFFWKKKVSMKLKHSNEDTEAVWMCQIIRFSLPVCLLSILF